MLSGELCKLSLFSVIITDEQVQEHYDEFFEEIFVELEDKVNTKFIFHVPVLDVFRVKPHLPSH